MEYGNFWQNVFVCLADSPKEIDPEEVHKLSRFFFLVQDDNRVEPSAPHCV